jgi:tetratricopeptide (TPR) repeat protein
MASTAPPLTGNWDALFIEFVDDVAQRWVTFWQRTESRAQRAAAAGHALRTLTWCTICGRSPDLAADLALSIHYDMMLTIPWNDWYDCLHQVLDHIREHIDVRRRRALIDALGEVCFRLGGEAEAIALTQENLALAEEAGDDRQRMLDYLRLAEIHLSNGRSETAFSCARQAAALATVVCDPVLHADAMIDTSRALIAQGQAELARPYLETALNAARRAGNLPYEAKALLFLGHVGRAGKRWQESLDYFRQALALVESYSDEVGRGVLLSNIGQCLMMLGRRREAQEALATALSIAQAHDNHPQVQVTERRLAALAAWPDSAGSFVLE